MAEDRPEERVPGRSAGRGSIGESATARMVEEAVGELAGLERRLPRTVLALLGKPGFLTREHREGRGSLYVSPIRLYIVSSTAYYASSFLTVPSGIDVGIVTIGSLPASLPLPLASSHLIAIAFVPVFALLLTGLFGGRAVAGRGEGPTLRSILGCYAEFLVFALYFQSLLFWLFPLLRLAPISEGVRAALGITLMIGYIGIAAHRLWSVSPVGGTIRAVFALVLYSCGIVCVTLGVLMVEIVLGFHVPSGAVR